jgi:hypothetical protein
MIRRRGLERRSEAVEPGIERREIRLGLQMEPATSDAFGDHGEQDLGPVGAP